MGVNRKEHGSHGLRITLEPVTALFWAHKPILSVVGIANKDLHSNNYQTQQAEALGIGKSDVLGCLGRENLYLDPMDHLHLRLKYLRVRSVKTSVKCLWEGIERVGG